MKMEIHAAKKPLDFLNNIRYNLLVKEVTRRLYLILKLNITDKYKKYIDCRLENGLQ